MKEIKFYPNGNKKKEVLDMTKNEKDFKLIIDYDVDGNVISAMKKPNLKAINPNILVSGAHVFANLEFNHVDFFQSGSLIYKAYPEIRGSTDYGYTISGATIVV